MWRRLRIPIFAGIAALVLAVLGAGVFFWVRSMIIRSAVEKARQEIALDTIDGVRGAVASLDDLAAEHPGRKDIQAALAYALALDSLRNGPAEPGAERARKAVSLSGPDGGGPLFRAASILVLVAEGKAGEAVASAGKLSREDLESDEVKLAKAMALAASGSDLEARVELELMAVEDDPYLPAITVLGQIRQRLGQNEASAALLRSSLEKHVGRLDAQLTLALALVETGTGEALAEADGILGSVGGEIDGAPPLLATRGHYARGLLLLEQGKYGEAVKPLSRAMEGMQGNPLAVARCAKARRLSGDVVGAFDTLSVLEIGESTPTMALTEVAESALAIWRPASAARALELIQGRPDLEAGGKSLLAARAALESGDFEAAAAAFRSAGQADSSPLRAALALVDAGHGKEARGLLKEIAEGPYGACAEALRSWLRGDPGKALAGLGSDPPCAIALEGRFLFLLGRHAEAVPLLRKALDAGDDPMVGIMLALSIYRVSGPGESMAILDGIAGLEPESVLLLGALSDAYLEMWRKEEALKAAHAAVARNAGDPDALALEARVLRLTGDAKAAASLVAQALPGNEKHAALMVEKAWALLGAGDPAEAAVAGQAAMDVSGPHYLDAAIVTARALDATRDESGSDNVLRKAASEIASSYEPSLATAVWAEIVRSRHARGGKPNLAKAKGSFAIAVKKEFPDAGLYFEGALVLIADGSKEEAMEWLHRAAVLDPAFSPAFAKLKALEALTDAEISSYEAVHGSAP